MNTSDILCVIKGHYLLSKTVRGVFSPDTLPSRVNTYPSAYICNTDPSHLPGQHWVVVWMETPRKAEFFDSLGQCPEHYDDRIKDFIIRNSEKFKCNEIRLQKRNSTTCGYHVLFYLLMKCRHYTLSDIVRLVSMQDDPDVFVYRYISQQTKCM